MKSPALIILALSTTLSNSFVQLLSRPPSNTRTCRPLHVSSIDSRNLIPTVFKNQTLFTVDQTSYSPATVSAVYVRHCLMQNLEAAEDVMSQIRRRSSYTTDLEAISPDPFGDITSLISNCEPSKEKRGDVGWIDRTSEKEYPGSEIFPPSARDSLFEQRMKPGDIHIIKSHLGHHIVKISDVTISKSAKNTFVGPKPTLKGSGIVSPSKAISKAKTYSIMTAGCQMNVADSERLEGQLTSLGLSPSNSTKTADVVVLNTCSIRDHAQSKVYDALGPIARRKRAGSEVALIVTGCVAQQEGQDLLKRVPEIDLVMGPQHVNRLPDLLESVSNGHQIVSTENTVISEDISKPVRSDKYRAWVNVIFGCNEHCSYCVVPNTRGVEQSRNPEHIFEECQQLGKEGYKEITLLGQNIDAYGRDLSPKGNFADLLAVVNKAEGIERIRYVTSHPRYFSDRVISAVRDLDKVCEQFHLPPQAGGNEVLKNMRRGYTFESYMKIVENIREKCPDASITGDIIVGFPGETEEQFQRTLDLMEAVHYDNLNSFAYSPRPFTDAALSEAQIPEDVKAERLQRVQDLSVKHGLERSQRYVGRTVEVLVEGANPKNAQEEVFGRNRQGRHVFFKGGVDLVGKLVNVKIEGARTWSLMGSIVK
ncbi:hypothetical protein TrST_g7801 [Triparma strigata]|uniref:Uncharacterized protein n=1 Tax=Triparma strigata TaxID=1606541 RepID=A0A9W7AYD5_9STRA|nr:hypothetical protein TrST_g7801 [Triparma strigata]